MSLHLEQLRTWMTVALREPWLQRLEVEVRARTLNPEEAIGQPGRRDYPLLVGKERMLEAVVDGARGQAFTDAPREFKGTIAEVSELPLSNNRERAVFIAVANALACRLGLVCDTVHCRDDEPETCAADIARQLRNLGVARVGLVGMNPAIAEALVSTFGSENVQIADKAPENIGTDKFGVQIQDGGLCLSDMVGSVDHLLVTGTTLANGSFGAIHGHLVLSSTPFHLFGVTGAAACAICKLPRLCFKAHSGAA